MVGPQSTVGRPVIFTEGLSMNNVYILLPVSRPAGEARATRTGPGGPAIPAACKERATKPASPRAAAASGHLLC